MDIKSPSLLYFKSCLFLLTGLLAGGLILFDSPHLKTAALLVICIWCFARAYYFAFYVIEHYIDPKFKFAGLLAFARYLMSRTIDG